MSSRLVRFLVSGGSAAAAEFIVFVLMFHVLSDLLLLSQTLSFCAGLIISFVLNRLWVFKSGSPLSSQAFGYGALAVFNLVLSNVIITLLIDLVQMPPLAAKFLLMTMIAVWNYTIFSKLLFKTVSPQA